MAHTAQADSPKAAVLLIGDELLSGSIQDTNAAWLAKLLHSRGCDMMRFECVPDASDAIADALHRMQSIVGLGGAVFTSGGIGPTHDDLTYEAVAAACGTQCEPHEETLRRMRVHYASRGTELNDARKRMATLPVGAHVEYTDNLDPPWVPLVELKGIFVLPGIPKLFQAMTCGLIERQPERFAGQQFHTEELYSHQGEGDLADILR